MRKKSSYKFHFILQKIFDYQSLKANSVKTVYHITSKKRDSESLGI